MKKHKFFSKGLQIAILAATVFSMSGLGVFITPNQAQAIEERVPTSKMETCDPGPTWAYRVMLKETKQGKNAAGDLIAANRSNPQEAVGPASNPIDALEFFSLGKDGYITLGFKGTIKDVAGPDLLFYEDTFGGNVNRMNYAEETADVFGKLYPEDEWTLLDSITNHVTDGVDSIDIGGKMPLLKYVRIADTSDYGQRNYTNGDGCS